MAYVRKTRDEYEVQGNYGHGYEAVTTEDTYREAKARLKEYRDNEMGISFRVKSIRVKLDGAA